MASEDTEAMRGEFYRILGAVRTNRNCVVALVDFKMKRYVPVFVLDSYGEMVGLLMSGAPRVPEKFGVFFSFWALLKACACKSARIIVERRDDDDGPYFASWLDAFHSSEAGVSMARVPISMPDACIISLFGEIPFVVYDDPDDPISASIPCGPGQESKVVLASVLADLIEEESKESEEDGSRDPGKGHEDSLEGDQEAE